MALVIGRKHGESVWIGDTRIEMSVRGNQTRFVIDAPKNIRVVRDELIERDMIEEERMRMGSPAMDSTEG